MPQSGVKNKHKQGILYVFLLFRHML